MKILVTGATGLVGSLVVPSLRERGHTVVSTSRDQAPPSTQGEVRHLDLTSSPDPSVMTDIDAVVHLAGIADRRANLSTGDFHRVNCAATLELAELAKRSGSRIFVFASTVLVHGDKAPDLIGPGSRIEPVGAYALSKAAAEDGLIAQSHSGDMNIEILRLAAVRPSVSHLEVGGPVEQLVQKLPIVPVPVPDNRRSTASPDIIFANIGEALARPTGSGARVRLVADGESGFGRDVAQAIEKSGRRRLQLPLPHILWRFTDALLGRFGAPSLAGAYDDLRIGSTRPAHR